MPRLSFSLRDVFWLTLVVGMGVGWGMREAELRRRLLLVAEENVVFENALRSQNVEIIRHRGHRTNVLFLPE